jgi:hypothetical protein
MERKREQKRRRALLGEMGLTIPVSPVVRTSLTDAADNDQSLP